MKKKIILISMLVLSMLFTGCGQKGSATTESTAANEYFSGAYGEADMEMPMDSAAEEKADTGAEELGSGITGVDATTVADPSQKLIYRVSMDMETKEYETLLEKVKASINSLGGYIENSEEYGNGYEDTYSTRRAYLVVRIPAKSKEDFKGKIGEWANVTSLQESVENITLQYVDNESRIQALTVEQERLLTLLEKADKLSDIITLEERLTQVRYELQSYESQKRSYDNDVDYATFSMSISEVARETPVHNDSLGSRIAEGFRSAAYNMKEGIQNLLIGIAYHIFGIVIWGIILVIAVILMKKKIKKKKEKALLLKSPKGTEESKDTKELKDTKE